jgi:hypothetical protein
MKNRQVPHRSVVGDGDDDVVWQRGAGVEFGRRAEAQQLRLTRA